MTSRSPIPVLAPLAHRNYRLLFTALVLAIFAIGASTAFFPAYTALVPHIVPAHDLVAGNGLEGATRPTVQQAIAPALIGVVIGAAAPAVGTAVVAAAFGLALLCSVRLPADGVERTGNRASLLTDFAGGFRYAVRTPWVLASGVFAAVMGLVVGGPIEVLLPTMIGAEHSNGAQVYGLLVAALGVGGFVGSMVAGSITMPRRYLNTMLGSWGLGCLPLASIALTSNALHCRRHPHHRWAQHLAGVAANRLRGNPR